MLSHLEGELFIARSSYVAPVEAAKLPDELRRAIDSSLAGVREGAVRELRHLLGAHDPGLAEAARQELERLAEDDSRRVAAAAARVLAGAQETVAPMPAARPEPAKPASEPVPAPDPPDPVIAAAELQSELVADTQAERTAGAGPRAQSRRIPFALSAVGALLALASMTVFASQPWEQSLRVTSVVTAVAAVLAAAIAGALMAGLRRRWLQAVEPVLAGVPIGLAAAAGGLKDQDGLYFPAWGAALGGLLLLLALALRQQEQVVARAPRRLSAIVGVAGAGLFLSPSLHWWYDTIGTDLLRWPLTAGLAVSGLVAMDSAGLGVWRGGRTWALLLGGAGGLAVLATVGIGNYAAVEGTDLNTSGPVLALLCGLVLVADGVVAMLRA
jgi:hypothetical protein